MTRPRSRCSTIVCNTVLTAAMDIIIPAPTNARITSDSTSDRESAKATSPAPKSAAERAMSRQSPWMDGRAAR